MKYKCIKKCLYNDRLWTPGETLETSDKPCKWFVASRDYKKPIVKEEIEAKTFAELHKMQAKAVLNSSGKVEAKKKEAEDDVLG